MIFHFLPGPISTKIKEGVEIKDNQMIEAPSSSWEDGFNSWVKNVAMSVEKDLLDIVNPKKIET